MRKGLHKSMTGFGRGEKRSPLGQIVVEVQSVNRKHLDVACALPPDWLRFELSVRKRIAEEISRGSVTVRVQFIPHWSSWKGQMPKSEELSALKQAWESIATSVGYSKEQIQLPFLLEQMGERRAFSVPAEVEECLFAALEKALETHRQTREEEGECLLSDIQNRFQTITSAIGKIEQTSPSFAAKMRIKLKERLEALFAPGEALDERLLREVALLAERADISEELLRFRSHLAQYELFVQRTGPLGRSLDFLLQEMGREINTIGSKAMDAEISHLVVEIKSELEKIREQVQNLE